MERTHGPLRETDGPFAGMRRLSLLIAVTYQKKKNREPVSRFAFRRLKNRLFINMTAYYARACRCRSPTLFSSLLFPSLLSTSLARPTFRYAIYFALARHALPV